MIYLGPYIQQYESRVRMVFRNDRIIPFEARLCVDHWRTEHDRVLMLFCPLPSTSMSKVVIKDSGSTKFPFQKRSPSVSTPERGMRKSPSLPQLPPSPLLKRKDNFLRRLSSINLQRSRSLSLLNNV
jgi:hypothetical protein